MKKNIIHELEIIGFKSFRDKTSISFQDDVIAIVGPNGCGKSNILDAIKWVIGERFSSDIRAENMEGVIFAGSKDAPPSNFAEVSLTFNNINKYFSYYDSDSLIKITRKIKRGGENQYFINNQKVLKKDIDALFINTGIGKSSYSFIEQGRINSIILSKPEKRRILFEEAAKVSKFKSEQQEALKNLEKTNSNLTKLKEIQGQIQNEITKKDEQNEKAKYYRTLLKNKNIFEQEIYMQKYFILREKLDNESKRVSTLLQQKQTNQQKSLLLKEKYILLKENKESLIQKRYKLEIQYEISKNQIKGYEDSKEQYYHNLNEYQKNNQRIEQKINDLQKNKIQTENEYQKIQTEITDLNNSQNNTNHKYNVQYTKLQQLQKELVQKQKQLSDKKKKKILTLNEIQNAYVKQTTLISELLEYLKQEKSKSKENYEKTTDIFQTLEKDLNSYLSTNDITTLHPTEAKKKITSWLNNIKILFKKSSTIYHSLFDKESIHSHKEELDQSIQYLEENSKKLGSIIELIETSIHKHIESIQKSHEIIAQINSQKKTISLKIENLLQTKEQIFVNLSEKKNILDFLEKERKENKIKEDKFLEKNKQESLNFKQQSQSIKNQTIEIQKKKKEHQLITQKEETEETILSNLKEKEKSLDISIQEKNIVIASYKGGLKVLLQELYNNFSITEEKIPKVKIVKNTSNLSIEKQLEKIKKYIQTLGDINLLAGEEIIELNEKFQHNEKQLHDISISQKYLQDLTEEIEKKSNIIFIEKFNEININFHKVFNLLFDGGDANLSLSNPEEPLKSGIQIMVSPPGKSNQPIQLLSGGEKTLTAISLMFALYLTNSSPFCILDEIDAPLDDGNVERYLKILNSYKNKTQFILITHNKQSMQQADSLLGISMKSPGISSIITTRLK